MRRKAGSAKSIYGCVRKHVEEQKRRLRCVTYRKWGVGVERGGGKTGRVDGWKEIFDTWGNPSDPSAFSLMLTS